MLRVLPACIAIIVSCATAFSAEPPAKAQGAEVPYTTMMGKSIVRHAWRGKHVAFLTEKADVDPATMSKLTDAFDHVYDYYRQATGQAPIENRTIDGLVPIAQVDETCGAGCGYLGATGVELQSGYFKELYDGVKERGEFDQVVFYEFGRNFWHYGAQLEYQGKDATGSITTGYAVFMRFMAVKAAGVKGGPFRDAPFSKFQSEVEKLVDTYLADKSLNWSNTLLVAKAPENPMGLGATDLFASFLFRLARDYGGDAYIDRIWKEAGKRPRAKTTQDAVDNFIFAASAAAGQDLTSLFADMWRWPVSAALREEAKKITAVVDAAPAGETLQLIPAPKNVQLAKGSLAIATGSRIVAADSATETLAKILSDEIALSTGVRLSTAVGDAKPADIALRIDPALKAEAYTVEVGTIATVTGGSYNAVASGTTTLLQALRAAAADDASLSIPCLTITDEPTYAYRGLLIDLARKYHSPGGIRQVIELCRLYKIRYLHLHISDDQLFMFPSTKFPRVGKGNHEFARFEPGSKPKVEPYTLEELKALEKFSSERGVHLVPEMDLPGHSGRLVGDAPEVFGFPGNGSTVNIASPKTLEAVATLMNEVMDVFESTPYVHLGADEVGLGGLEKTPEYAEAVNKLGDVHSPHDLYCKFIVDLHDIVAKRGKKVIVWEEAWNAGGAYPLPKDAVVMSWSMGRDPAEIIKSGYSVINAGWTPLYIVRDNKKSLDFLMDWDVTKFGREGSNDFLSLPDSDKIMGAQMCSWEDSESIEIQSLRDRLALIAERTWSPKSKSAPAEFRSRLVHTDTVLEKLVNPITIEVQGTFTKDENTFSEPLTVTLTTDRKGLSIRYTLDNTLPSAAWKMYSAPITLDQTAYLRAGLFDDQGKQHEELVGGWYRRVQVVKPNLATHKPVTEGPGPARNDAWAAGVAVDGRADDPNGHWASSDAAPQWLKIDLQKVYPVDSMTVITYWDGSRYYQLNAEVSVDGKEWKKVLDTGDDKAPATSAGYSAKFAKTDARYVRVNMLKNSANPFVHIVEVIVNEAK